jgi:hypothetical protein
VRCGLVRDGTVKSDDGMTALPGAPAMGEELE